MTGPECDPARRRLKRSPFNVLSDRELRGVRMFAPISAIALIRFSAFLSVLLTTLVASS
jgi:hypothetical protein